MMEMRHRALLPREFERQDMAKLFNQKTKTRFPILFKNTFYSQFISIKTIITHIS